MNELGKEDLNPCWAKAPLKISSLLLSQVTTFLNVVMISNSNIGRNKVIFIGRKGEVQNLCQFFITVYIPVAVNSSLVNMLSK